MSCEIKQDHGALKSKAELHLLQEVLSFSAIQFQFLSWLFFFFSDFIKT